MEWLPITLTRLLDPAPAYLSVLNLHYCHFFIMRLHTGLLTFPHTYQTCSYLRVFVLALPSAWCSFPIPFCGCLFFILQVSNIISSQDWLPFLTYLPHRAHPTPLPSHSPSQVDIFYKGPEYKYSSLWRPDGLSHNSSRFLF